MKREIDLKLIGLVVFSCLIMFALLYTYSSVEAYENRATQQQAENVREVLKKAAVQCFALEGSYPPDLEYLAENYDIVLDTDKYFYYYEIAGSNLVPNIRVIIK